MKLTKGIISRDAAFALCPDYVRFIEAEPFGFLKIAEQFEKVRKGQEAITFHKDGEGGVYVRVKVSHVDRSSIRAIDGPVVRVGNGEYTWRIDGNRYAHLLPFGVEQCKELVDKAMGA